MWKKVKQSDVGTRRENGWQELLQSGSRIMRFDDTFASAWEIIDNVVKTRIFNPTTSQAASLESRAKSDQLAGRIAELTRPRISYVFPSIQHSVGWFSDTQEGVDAVLTSRSDGFFQRDIDTEPSLEAFTRTRTCHIPVWYTTIIDMPQGLRKLIYLPMFSQKISTGSKYEVIFTNHLLITRGLPAAEDL